MIADNPSLISYLYLTSYCYPQAVAFYDQVLASLGARSLIKRSNVTAYGRLYPQLWLRRAERSVAAPQGETRVAFAANSRDEVERFYRCALVSGARSGTEPGPVVESCEPYYGCAVLDLDGHRLEASYWDIELAGQFR